MNDRFLNKGEIAKFLGYSIYTIDRYVKNKNMPVHRFCIEPRYLMNEVLKWAEQFKQKA